MSDLELDRPVPTLRRLVGLRCGVCDVPLPVPETHCVMCGEPTCSHHLAAHVCAICRDEPPSRPTR